MSSGAQETPPDPGMNSSNKRRSSSRNIKRRKFDDELVESSLSTPGSSVPSRPGRMRTHSGTNPVSDPPPANPNDAVSSEAFPPAELNVSVNRGRKRPSSAISSVATIIGTGVTGPSSATPSGGGRKRKMTKPNFSTTYKDMGRWKPVDDLLLMENVVHTQDLRAVHQGVKFSCKFTFNEITQRWNALLYDRTISQLSLSAIRNLSPETVAQVESTLLHAEAEEEVIGSIKSTVEPKLQTFHTLLENNRHIFHRYRTPKSLYKHWCMMKKYNLLSDQVGNEKPISIPTMVATEERNNALINSFGTIPDTPLQRSESIPTFAECEEFLNDSELLGEVKDPAFDRQMDLMDRISKKDIRMLEDELSQIQIAASSIPGANPAEFDNETLAVLRGQCVRYLMRSREITLGRRTKDNEVDVDLALEGPAWKISRRQATIRVKSNGEFHIASEGKHPIYVDGNPVLTGDKRMLNHNSVLEICGLRFIFLINYEFLNTVIRYDAAKMTSSQS